MNNTIRLGNFPKRIVSLVPSQTELLFDLGMNDEVVGITKFCIHPKEWFDTKVRIGGTKDVDFEKIKNLRPDLVIANKEENTKEIIENLQVNIPVYVSDIYTVEDALKMIFDIGILVNRSRKAQQIISQIETEFRESKLFNGGVLYFMWNNPYMVAGNQTFIGDIIRKLGFINCFDSNDGRYKEISMDSIKTSQADYLFLSTEPFPFTKKHQQILEEKTGKKVIIVDGEIFSWYGSRMLKMHSYFKSTLQRDLQDNF